jgi:CRP-like cAMP-binding protein
MRYVSPGEEFGIIAVLSEINFPVTSQAVTDSEVIVWNDETLRRLMMERAQIAVNGMRILSARVQEFQQRTQELSTERMERRIARALLRLAQQSGKKVPAGVQIDLRLTRQDLAELTGTSMYSVSRTLSQWENLGLINASREHVTICLPHELVRIAEDLQ